MCLSAKFPCNNKGFLDDVFMFKESEKNLIHSISKFIYFWLSHNKGLLKFLFNFREFEKKRRLHGGFFFVNLVFQSQKGIKLYKE